MTEPTHPLYHHLLGETAARLPPVVARMHAVAPIVIATGIGTVRHGDTLVARAFAWCLRLPAPGIDRPLRVTFVRAGDTEILSRRFPDTTLRTRQMPAGPAGSGLLVERFGPLDLLLHLVAGATGLRFDLVGVRCLGLPLPKFAWPRLAASENAAGDSYRFHVRIGLPLVGLLIEYQGGLQIEEADPATRHEPLVLFDGVCNLCTWSVRFLAPRDRGDRLYFAAVQSETGQAVSRRHNLATSNWDSFVFCEHGIAYRRAEACFRVLPYLRWPWPLLGAFGILPRRWADFLYDRIARNRYALFGRRATCLVADARMKARLLP